MGIGTLNTKPYWNAASSDDLSSYGFFREDIKDNEYSKIGELYVAGGLVELEVAQKLWGYLEIV